MRRKRKHERQLVDAIEALTAEVQRQNDLQQRLSTATDGQSMAALAEMVSAKLSGHTLGVGDGPVVRY